MPTYNRPHELTNCLRSLTALNYPHDSFEIVVVDDGGSADLSAAIAHAKGVAVRLLRQENQGPGAARNTGAQAASGRWLAFTDDDCCARADWLTAFREALVRDENVLAGGRTLNRLETNPCATASQLIADAAYRFYNEEPDNARFLASNNIAVSRDKFLAAGGFDESFRIASEDRELCDRWIWKAGRIVYVPNAVIEHRHDLKFFSFVRQHYRYGQGAAQYHRLRTARGTGSLWLDTAFRWRWRDLLFAPAMSTRRPLRTLALLLCWQAANTAGFLRDSLPGLRRS